MTAFVSGRRDSNDIWRVKADEMPPLKRISAHGMPPAHFQTNNETRKIGRERSYRARRGDMR